MVDDSVSVRVGMPPHIWAFQPYSAGLVSPYHFHQLQSGNTRCVANGAPFL